MFRSCRLLCPVERSTTQVLQLAKQRYEQDGFCFPLHFFPAQLFRERFFPRYEAFRRACLHQQKWSDYRFKSHLLLPWLHDLLVKSENLKETARTLLATDDVVIWSTDWCVKPKSSEHHFTWHQDSTYSKFGQDGATLWLAFSDVRATSGPLLFRRSSHLLGQLPHVESEDESNLLAFGQYIPEFQDEQNDVDSEASASDWKCMEIVAAELHPGEASAHSFFTIHRSSANQDPFDRVGLAIRIVRASAGVDRSDRVTHLCGRSETFELEAAPHTEFGGRELQEWHLSMEREKAMYFADRERCNYK